MTQILIHLESGPAGQLAGQLTTGAGEVVVFTGWLHLLRLLEDEVRAVETASFEHEGLPLAPAAGRAGVSEAIRP